MKDYNKYFAIEAGGAVSEEELQCLIAEKRCWTTRCRMDRATAMRAMPHIDPLEFNEEETTYGGLIVTTVPEDLQEAELIANQRGWGESVEGVLYGIIPHDHQFIETTAIKNLN